MTVLNINCSPKSPCIPCYVISKYDRPALEKVIWKSLITVAAISPHTGFSRSRLSHQQNFLSVHDSSAMADYFKESFLLKTVISDPGKVVCLTKFFKGFWGGAASQRVFILDFSDARLPWFIITSPLHFSRPVGCSVFLIRNVVPGTNIENQGWTF